MLTLTTTTTTSLLFLLMITLIHALPVTFTSNNNNKNQRLQTVLYTQSTKAFDDLPIESWFLSQEYDIFSSITDYYENMIDITLNSGSEDLLINLVHLPQDIKTSVLIKQAELIGIHSLSDTQLIKMPSIIGKHVQALNQMVYESIESIITLYWHTIWDPRLLAKKDQQEEHMLSFLSSFNGIVAKKLMDNIDEYDLIQEIKADLLALAPASYQSQKGQEEEQEEQEEEEEEIELTMLELIKIYLNQFLNTKTTTITFVNNNNIKNYFDLETDFLREYLYDMRTNLLLELHIQFMDFFTRIQTDIIDQLSIYYDEEL